jgi:hypothetical protein
MAERDIKLVPLPDDRLTHGNYYLNGATHD